jgi:putative hydrolase of the HAD superfamily
MTTQAVFFDAMGTLVELEPPWPRLADALGLGEEQVRPALRKEMAYYRDHAHEAIDAASLQELRARCAALVERELGVAVSADVLMGSIRFRAYDDALPALTRLRELGLRLVCVSNWDYALPMVLAEVGLAEALDFTVTSAAVGARKPDPAIFRAALDQARCDPDQALHVGDSPAEDIAGARAAGIRALLIDRDGGGDVASLAEIETCLSTCLSK